MKRIFLYLSLLLTDFISGQNERSTLFLGPSINYSQSRNYNKPENSPVRTENKFATLNVNMRLGYFVADNVALGIIGGFSNSVSRNEWWNGMTPGFVESSETITNIVSAGLFGRGYKLFNENKFGFFFQLNGVYQSGNSTTTDKTTQASQTVNRKSTGKVTGYSVGLQPGFVYFVTKKLGLECSIGNIYYSNLTQRNYFQGEKTSTSILDGMNVNFNGSSFYVGLNFYLN